LPLAGRASDGVLPSLFMSWEIGWLSPGASSFGRKRAFQEWQESLVFCLSPLFKRCFAKIDNQLTSLSFFSKRHAPSVREMNMNYFDYLLQRNKDFAAQHSAVGTVMPSLPRALPNVRAIIIGCADIRVDPAHVLGIKPGEAVVMRNIGGRITPGLLEQLGLLGRIGEVAREIPGGGQEFHIIVLQHTDCGITRLAGDTDMLTRYFQIPESELRTKAVTDPRAAVAVDVASLRAIHALPAAWLLSGLVYDVATGLVETVVPPAPIHAAQISEVAFVGLGL
jgi:carbonic anhydrase